MSIRSGLEMFPSGRKDARMMVGVAKFSKSPLFEIEEQVKDKQVAFQEPKENQHAKGVLQHHHFKRIFLIKCNQISKLIERCSL